MDINEFEIEAFRRIKVEIERKQKHMDNFFFKFNIPKREIKFDILFSLHFKIHDYLQHHNGRFESGFVWMFGCVCMRYGCL